MALDIDWGRLDRELEYRGKGARGDLLQQYCNTYGCSKDALYRGLRKHRGKKFTIQRDPQVDAALIDAIAQLKIKGMELGLKERELSTERCIRKLVNQYGVVDAENLSVSTVNRNLRKVGFRIRDPKVRVEMDHANQEHQMDFSRSKYFQLTTWDNEKKDYILKVSGKELHYKDENRRIRTWIVSVKDSYSRIRLARAYGATGESINMGLDFLNWVWNREHDDHPMRHLPERLKTDNGAFAKSKEVIKVMDAYNIELFRSTPGNKDSQGKIESGFHALWNCFELDFAMDLGDGAEVTLSEYNERLFQYCVEESEKQHPFRKFVTREMDYKESIMSHPPREINADVRQYAFQTFERSVDQARMVWIDNKPYRAPGFAEGKRIRILRNRRGEFIGEMMDEGRESFNLAPYEYTRDGDYEHREHATYKQKMARVVEEIEKGTYDEKDDSWEDIKQSIQPSVTVEAESPFNNKEIFGSEREAKLYIADRLPAGHVYADYAEVFSSLLQGEINKEAIDIVLKQIPIMESETQRRDYE